MQKAAAANSPSESNPASPSSSSSSSGGGKHGSPPSTEDMNPEVESISEAHLQKVAASESKESLLVSASDDDSSRSSVKKSTGSDNDSRNTTDSAATHTHTPKDKDVMKKSPGIKGKYERKSLKEIEKEVAENTAKFDADSLQGKHKTKKESSAGAMPRLKVTASNITPDAIMKLIRLLLIVAMSVYTGTDRVYSVV